MDSDDDYCAGDSDSHFSQAPSDEDDPMEIEPPVVRKSIFSVMNFPDVVEKQRRVLNDIQEVLAVEPEESYALLRNYGWDSARLQEAWFDDENRVREKAGVFTPASSSTAPPSFGQSSCPICLMECPAGQVFSLRCGHSVCNVCWKGYLNSQADDGKAAIQAKCVVPKCNTAVPVSVFEKFCDKGQLEKFEKWYQRSYVDDNPSMKWCPNPAGCDFAIEYQGSDPLEVKCGCNYHFCWLCSEEAHRPASCRHVQQWNLKNSAESENVSWIMANTKKCPKCHRPIEKNQGCNHMVCSKSGGCGFEFCWLCLGEWSTHGSGTGGYYQCNIYDKQAKEGKHDEEEKTRQRAKHALDKYMFYFERFMNHDKGMRYAVKEFAQIETKVQALHDKHGFDIIELQFLYDALEQVKQSRRVLKWTYVYGYYLDEQSVEKNLFEHLQKNLEEKIDHLHEMIEKDFDTQFFSSEAATPGSSGAAESGAAHIKFMDFRSHITNFTNVTQKFLAQIITDLGQGQSLASTSI